MTLLTTLFSIFAQPNWYDFCHSITFQSDGYVEFQSGGGQAIHLICGGNFKCQIDPTIVPSKDVIEKGWLDIEFGLPRNHKLRSYMPRLQDFQKRKYRVPYQIRQGPFLCDGDYYSWKKQIFMYRVEFETSPFPAEIAQFSLWHIMEGVHHQSHLVFYSEPNIPLQETINTSFYEQNMIRWEQKCRSLRRLEEEREAHEPEFKPMYSWVRGSFQANQKYNKNMQRFHGNHDPHDVYSHHEI